MSQTPPQSASAGHYRYLVLAASVLSLMVGQGALFLLVVSLKDIATTFNWPRVVPSLGYALQFVGAGLGGILMGHWLDRSGMAKPALIGAVMIGSGTLLASRIESPWHLYLIYGGMIGFLGQATLYSPLLANVMRWFNHRRGMAVGIVSSGQTLAGTVWPPIFSQFNLLFGWRETFVWYGAFALLAMLPMSLVFRREPPPLEDADDTPPDGSLQASRGVPLSPFAIQTLLGVAVVGCCVAMSLPLTHIVAYASDLGHAPAQAAGVLSVMLLTATACRMVGVGLLSDRYGGLFALFVFSSIQAATLLLFTVAQGLLALYLLAMAFGFGYAGVIPCYAVTIRDHLPAREAGRRTAMVILFGAIGMAIGSTLGGALYDMTGGYATAFLIGVAFNVGNLAIIGLLLRRVRRRERRVAA